jgi:hypothetical protein
LLFGNKLELNQRPVFPHIYSDNSYTQPWMLGCLFIELHTVNCAFVLAINYDGVNFDLLSQSRFCCLNAPINLCQMAERPCGRQCLQFRGDSPQEEGERTFPGKVTQISPPAGCWTAQALLTAVLALIFKVKHKSRKWMNMSFSDPRKPQPELRHLCHNFRPKRHFFACLIARFRTR